nr:hypothetical protein [Tanacetum cinerariifolium]
MNLLNGTCNNCIYGDGKTITCSICEGMLRGGFCLPFNLKAENSFICDQNAYSFNDTSNNSNYLPQPQYENYLCNLCGNNSHDGYDCQQQFTFVYEQDPSYNQNYNDNYYPHESPNFPCCDNCGESHETLQCQPMDQNIDFFGSDQIRTPQYPEIHPPSQEISDEVFQANHSVQYKEDLENSSNSNQDKEGPPQDSDIRQLIREECCIEVCEEQKHNMENTILEMVEICRKKELLCMHDNVDDLIESALNSKLLSINSQRLDKKEQEVKNVIEQPAERRTLAPILSTKGPEYSTSMGYEHPNTTPETKSDEIIKSGVEELVPIPCENEIFSDSNNDDDISSDDDDFEDIEHVEASLPDPEIVSVDEENVVHQEEEEVDLEDDLEDISQIQDIVLREKLLSINRLIANIESLNDNPTPDRVLNSFVSFSIPEESDNSLSDNFSPEFKTFCDHTEEMRSGNTTTHADNSLPEYDSFCFEIEPDQERLINFVKNNISNNSSNDPLLEEVDLFLASDNSIPPGIENFGDDSEGDIRFLDALLIDDSIPFPNNESSEFDFDNPSFPRPSPEPPDADFKLETGEEIVMNIIDKFECLDPKDEFDDDDYSCFMFVKVFSFLSAESEDTIFDPGISV